MPVVGYSRKYNFNGMNASQVHLCMKFRIVTIVFTYNEHKRFASNALLGFQEGSKVIEYDQ